MAGMIPFQDISQDAQNAPLQNATAGLPTEWIFKLNAGNSSVTDNLASCCDTILSYNGVCAEDAPFALMMVNYLLEVSILRAYLALLRQDPTFGKDSNDVCGIYLIARVKQIGTPSFNIMQPHQGDTYQLHRHAEVRRMVLSTHRGSRIHRHILCAASIWKEEPEVLGMWTYERRVPWGSGRGASRGVRGTVPSRCTQSYPMRRLSTGRPASRRRFPQSPKPRARHNLPIGNDRPNQ